MLVVTFMINTSRPSELFGNPFRFRESVGTTRMFYGDESFPYTGRGKTGRGVGFGSDRPSPSCGGERKSGRKDVNDLGDIFCNLF